MNIKMDLSKFKHLKSDDNTTTLQHKTDGHQIILAHKALPKEHQEQLKALAGIAKEAATPEQADEIKHQSGQKMADGGSTDQQYDQFGYPVKDKTKSTSPDPLSGYSEGGEVNPKLDESKKEPTPYQPPKHGPTNIGRDGGGYGKIIDKTKEPSKVYGKVIHKAEGGVCHACGGEIKHYDEGGDVTQNSTPADLPQPAPPVIPAYGVADPVRSENPDLQHHPEIAKSSEEAIDKGNAYNREYFKSLAEQSGLQDPGAVDPKNIFTNGKPPEAGIDPKIANTAIAKYDQSKIDKAQQVSQDQTKAAADLAEYNKAAQAYGLPQKQGTGTEAATQQVIDQNAPQPPDMTKPAVPTDMGNAMMNQQQEGFEKGFGLQEKAARQQAGALQTLGTAESGVQQQASTAARDAATAVQDLTREHETEFQNALKDYQQGMISPDKYWQGDPQTGAGGHSKVLAGIGMLLAGFNPTNRPNAAIEMFKYQMDNSLKAQAQNQNTRGSILQANMQHFRDRKDAIDASKIMMMDAFSHDMQQAASQAKGPLAQAAMNNTLGQVQNERTKLNMGLNMRRAIMSMTNSPNAAPGSVGQGINYLESAGAPEAKDFRARYVPSMDVIADKPLEASTMAKFEGYEHMNSGLKNLQNFVKTHSSILHNPASSDYNRSVAEAKLMQATIREGTLGTVYREGEQPLLDQILSGNPAGLDSVFGKTQTQLKTLMDANDRARKDTMKTYGIRPRLGQGQPQGQGYRPKSFQPAGS